MTSTMPKAAEWVVCPRCRTLLYGRRFERGLKVCPDCNAHTPLTAPERLAQLMDPDSVKLFDVVTPADSEYGFADTVSYSDRLAAARESTGLDEAVVCARGTIDGRPVVAAVMDFRFMGGSLGSVVGELVTQAAECALRDRTPFLIVTASGGARMQEGALALMQMAKTSQAIGELGAAGVLTVSLITDPTYGGVAASFATLTDVIIAEPGARLGFAGPRVIQQTIKQAPPAGFQAAEALLANGMIDMIKPRTALRQTLSRLLAVATSTPAVSLRGVGVSVRSPELLADDEPWQVVRQARDPERPTTLDYAAHLLDSFDELHGDRSSGDCPAIIGGVGQLGDQPVMLIGHQKGHRPVELAARNFGMATPAGHRKAARLMRLAARLGIPIVTLIDTPGAYPGVEAEAGGQAVSIAENLRLMSSLPVPVVSVVTGEGGSGGALALGVGNRVLMMSNAVYSVISPEGCAAILWKDAGEAPRAAAQLRLRARDLLESGVVDAVVPEPQGGAQRAPFDAAATLQDAVIEALAELSLMDPAGLVADRRARFRRMALGSRGSSGEYGGA